jgi:hypothetical protein
MVLTCITLLMPAFSLLLTPPVLTVWLLRRRTLPYHYAPKGAIHSFGDKLEPRYIFGAESLDQ